MSISRTRKNEQAGIGTYSLYDVLLIPLPLPGLGIIHQLYQALDIPNYE